MNRKVFADQTSDYKFLPDYYLAGFTEKNILEDRIWALDRKRGLQIETLPREAARGQEVNPPGSGTYSIEADLMARAADETASVINRISETQTLPAGSDFALLLDFIAAVLQNLPAPRKMVDRFADDLAEKILSLAADSKESYQGSLAKIEEDSGVKVPTFEEAVAVLQSDKHDTPEDQRLCIRSGLNRTRLALSHIESRTWGVIINDSPDHLFITADMPAALVSLNESGYYGPNLRSPGTVIYLPLSSRVILVGRSRETPETSRVKGVREVARLNTLVIGGKSRFIYSPRENFVYMNPLKRLSFKDDLIKKPEKRDKKPPRG